MTHPLHTWLERNKHSQKWLADQLSTPESVISKMIHGTSLPRTETLLAISKLTGLDIKTLMEQRR